MCHFALQVAMNGICTSGFTGSSELFYVRGGEDSELSFGKEQDATLGGGK